MLKQGETEHWVRVLLYAFLVIMQSVDRLKLIQPDLKIFNHWGQLLQSHRLINPADQQIGNIELIRTPQFLFDEPVLLFVGSNLLLELKSQSMEVLFQIEHLKIPEVLLQNWLQPIHLPVVPKGVEKLSIFSN